jgi:hypothetical protein
MMLIRPDPVPDLNYLTLTLVSDSTLSMHTVSMHFGFSRPQPGCHLLNSPGPGITKLFPAREVSDIPAGVGKTANLFLQCTVE